MYVYAFCQPPQTPIVLPIGIVEPVHIVLHGDLAAVTETGLDFEAITATDNQLMQAVMAHDRVLCELCRHMTLLPLQFGTRFHSEAGLQQHLTQNREAYHHQLDRLRNQGEYLLKLVPLEPWTPTATAPSKGRDYFVAKKQHYQAQVDHQQQQQAELQALLAAIAQHYPHWVHSASEDGVERIYLLTPRFQELSLHQQVQTWQHQFLHWELSLSPPLPPYHFVQN